ncbi:MAG: ribosome biogenesis GTP-binding protein YihA/YsxC [Saprospiraceae bacterium]|nr:ribosome biogenesis GTP-binding protein YihA/YsxC [Saprospiraceae bacterium]
MEIKEVEFIGSFERESQCPKDMVPEYAFIGRSNVGKSSLINMLCNRKGLAKVSNTPGKTQTINYFRVDDAWHLVDLPGYGYAKISKKMRHKWESMIERYLITRPQLQVIFVLLDSRHELQSIDLEFVNWLGDRRVPFVLVYTKIDKLKRLQVEDNIKRIQNGLLKYWNTLPDQFITSSEKKEGRQEILDFIGDLNNNF